MSKVLLLSCYESGFQPLHLARPLAMMQNRGLEIEALDLSVQTLKEVPNHDFAGIAISVPMQTALRLGVSASLALRKRWPQASICLFGLYAYLNAEHLLDIGAADRVLAGEIEEELADWAEGIVKGNGRSGSSPSSHHQPSPTLIRLQLPVPQRQSLPPLTSYAHLLTAQGVALPAGQTETSRGCLHECLHCPVVPVYNGRFFVVDFDTVTADIQQQIEAGARHISFGDPDFLNGPGHSLRVTEWLHARHPGVTFDFTTKVEHIRRYPQHLQTLREHGAAFAVSAFESTQDEVLRHLDKGHSAHDMEQALSFLRSIDLPLHPTWIPFTPWGGLRDYIDLLDWIEHHGLVYSTPPLQLSLRLLIPPHSRLLPTFKDCAWLGALQPDQFTYQWTHPDPAVDRLHADVASLMEGLGDAWDHGAVFQEVRALAHRAAHLPVPDRPLGPQMPPPPRLTEDWFC